MAPGDDISYLVHSVVEKVVARYRPGGRSTGTSLDGNPAFRNHASHAQAAPLLIGFSEAMVQGFRGSLAAIAIAFILSFFLTATAFGRSRPKEEVADPDAATLAAKNAEILNAALEPSPVRNAPLTCSFGERLFLCLTAAAGSAYSYAIA